ncbi:Zinc finger, C2H2 domain-containing protein [Rozella allomycis CSF55]|uniref:Zinc finger, C2H2 domain-containing protein n=1 Tax=Rozella allomycis (strain CSF55) TaxID=988480 RepID=A0A075ARR2_ROZAC|nr:Zinc finger, C2H2 domain-containing protein [Rozella allomycis CSF55]|eukprot:EPZ32928.1 Zinc finger, C2H2 domain-containing protein [Rozella allomycis CSF55]
MMNAAFYYDLAPSSMTSFSDKYICTFEICQNNTSFDSSWGFLKHLFDIHRIAVNNVEDVLPFLQEYIDYYKCKGIDSFEGEITILGAGPAGNDLILRNELHKEKLDKLLHRQEEERIETKARQCLFCKKVFTNKRSYVRHMYIEHSFNIGAPDNIVLFDDFMSLLKKKLDENYVELKKEINLNDEQEILSEKETWEDWWDNSKEAQTLSLFGQRYFDTPFDAIMEVKDEFKFDIKEFVIAKGLDVYERIKLINYIRRKTSELSCITCNTKFKNSDTLKDHYCNTNHIFLLEKDNFVSSEFLYPILADDPLLWYVDELFGDC